MPDVENERKIAVEMLLQNEEKQLYEELGIRSKAMGKEPTIAGSFTPDVSYDQTEMGLLDDVRNLGLRIFKRWNKEAHNLLCGKDDENSDDRKKLMDAFGVSEVAVAGVIAGLIITNFGLAPAIAAVIAAIIIKKFFKPGWGEFCEFWAGKLDD